MGSIIRAWEERHPGDGLKFMFAGQGDFNVLAQSLGEELTKVRTVYLGSLEGRQRARVVGGALAMMMPTNFVEPFGGAGVEGMLTGTPLLASDWGAFTETVAKRWKIGSMRSKGCIFL
jgi:glycosyltransferase involved in cell wall biosynthesis